MTTIALLELSKVSKKFSSVLANDQVSLSVEKGQIHALLGENGAGKSTLVKIIYGILQPDQGSMLLDGNRFMPKNPSEARNKRIGMVFQHFSLFETLTVAENIELGISKEQANIKLNQRILDISHAYGLPINPKKRVDGLSVGECQRVEVVRCLLRKPRLLIMDEPTSVLTPKEAQLLFKTLKKLSRDGCSILYISHKLEEIKTLCDWATILRNGRVVGQCNPREETTQSLAKMMIGSSIKVPSHTKASFGTKRLIISSLSSKNLNPLGTNLNDISFTVHSGEILGIAGVAGNGQTELMEALSGETTTDIDSIQIDHKPVGQFGPTIRRNLGMCFIPEQRIGHAVAADMSLWENCILSARTKRNLEKNNLLDIHAANQFANKVVKAFKVKVTNVNCPARSLSGGNLQKFIVGREILQNPKILVVMQPTWGVDVSAAVEIHFALHELAKKGAAVLVISQDLDELITISDNFAVMSEGRLSRPMPTANMTAEQIGLLIGTSPPKSMSGMSR